MTASSEPAAPLSVKALAVNLASSRVVVCAADGENTLLTILNSHEGSMLSSALNFKLKISGTLPGMHLKADGAAIIALAEGPQASLKIVSVDTITSIVD